MAMIPEQFITPLHASFIRGLQSNWPLHPFFAAPGLYEYLGLLDPTQAFAVAVTTEFMHSTNPKLAWEKLAFNLGAVAGFWVQPEDKAHIRFYCVLPDTLRQDGYIAYKVKAPSPGDSK